MSETYPEPISDDLNDDRSEGGAVPDEPEAAQAQEGVQEAFE